MPTKTILPASELCERVAKELGFNKVKDGLTGTFYLDNGYTILNNYKDLLKPQGRELMENHAFYKFRCWPMIEAAELAFVSVDLIMFTDALAFKKETDNYSIIENGKLIMNRAIFLAFAQLTKCYNPDEEEVEW